MRWSILCVLVLVLSFVAAQEKKDKVRGVLPLNYRRLNLTDEQLKRVYKISADYRAKIAELEKQIDKLKAEQAAEMEKVLTAEQQKKLRELKTGERAPGK